MPPILKTLVILALTATASFAQSMPNMASPADKSFAAGMNGMNKAMSAAPMTGDADQDFVAQMLPHHQGAVAMAQTELQYGKDPQMRALAKSIIAAQNREIALMHAWQKSHPAP